MVFQFVRRLLTRVDQLWYTKNWCDIASLSADRAKEKSPFSAVPQSSAASTSLYPFISSFLTQNTLTYYSVHLRGHEILETIAFGSKECNIANG